MPRYSTIELARPERDKLTKFRLVRFCLAAAPKLAVGAAELLARPVMDFHDLRRQILIANQPSRTAAGFRSRSVPAWDWDRCSPFLR